MNDEPISTTIENADANVPAEHAAATSSSEPTAEPIPNATTEAHAEPIPNATTEPIAEPVATSSEGAETVVSPADVPAANVEPAMPLPPVRARQVQNPAMTEPVTIDYVPPAPIADPNNPENRPELSAPPIAEGEAPAAAEGTTTSSSATDAQQ